MRDTAPLTSLAFHVLLALADGPGHGYAIGKEVKRRSHGDLDPATGSLYQALKRLHADGLIAEAAVHGEQDARRQYFRLTPRGRQAAAAEARRMAELVDLARRKSLLSKAEWVTAIATDP